MKATKYFVYLDGGDQYVWFDDEVDAIVYAQKNGNKDTRIEKVEGELSDDGFDFDYDETKTEPVEFSLELPEEEPVEFVDDPEDFDMDFPDIPDVESSDDTDYDAMAKQYADAQLVDPYEADEFDGHEDFDVKEALDKLEENESEVECKGCFELFPKEECIKTEQGYFCKKCNQELHSHQGTNLDLIDANPKDIDYDDPRLPEEEEEPKEEKKEPVDANEIRKHEAGIDENFKRKLSDESDVFDYYYNNWLDCEVDYDTLYSIFELGLEGKKFPDTKLVKAYGWGKDYDYLESMYDTGKDIHKRGLQAVIDEMAQDYALDNADDMNDPKEVQTLEEDTFETLDELNAEARKVYHYSCDPSGIEGSVDATSEKEAQRKVEEILAGKGIYVPDEIITINEGVTEDLKVITDFSKYEPWSGAVNTYELIKDADRLDDLEAYLEELYPDGLTVTKINDILWFDGEQVLRDLGLGDDDDTDEYEDDVEELPDATQTEGLEEHINDRPADIESDQKYQGVDNAVVDCKKYTLVAHSEDEKPVDCKLEKPALEEPLAGEEVDAKLYEDIDNDEKYLKDLYNSIPEDLKQKLEVEVEYYGDDNFVGDIMFNLGLNKDIIEAARQLGKFLVDSLDKEKYEYNIWNPETSIEEQDINDYVDRYFDARNELEAEYKDEDLSDWDYVNFAVYKKAVNESLEEAKKDEEELPPDPEVVKLEVHQELNNLVADEIEAIDGYEEVKADIIDKPIEHKDEIVDTINHIEDEEKEHIDELVDATSEIPFEGGHKEEAPAPAVEEPVVEEPLEQDFPEVEEDLEESAAEIPFDSDVKVGDSILIIDMEGEPDYCGRKGKVEHIDGIGQLHGTWGGCAVIPGVDKFDIITEESLEEDAKAPKYKAIVSWTGTFCGTKRVYKNDSFHTYEFDHEPTEQEVADKFYNDPTVIRLKNWNINHVRKEVRDFMDGVYDNDDGWKDIKLTGYKVKPIKEDLKEDVDPKETQFVFTPEEQAEYNCDEEGNCEGSYDQLCHCGWCGDVFPTSEMRHEADFGWICSRCEDELRSHGGPLTFIENENLEEASSAETRAFKNGGQDAKDYIQGKAIARIKDPKARAAAVAAVKAGRPDAVKAFTGDRKEDQAAAAYEKKAQAMADAGVKETQSQEQEPAKPENSAADNVLNVMNDWSK